MKNLLIALALSLGLAAPVLAADENKTETKKVCVDVKDKDGKVVKDKDGKNKQNCRDVKVHQKHEGTKVPTDGKK